MNVGDRVRHLHSTSKTMIGEIAGGELHPDGSHGWYVKWENWIGGEYDEDELLGPLPPIGDSEALDRWLG